MLLESRIITDILGSDPKDYTVLQVTLRGIITYFFTVLIIKIGHKRFLGQATTFDAVLGFILGSVMSRAVNGQSAFIPTLAAGFVLVGVHWIVGWIGLRVHSVAEFFKGEPHILMRHGKADPAILRKHLITTEEIEQYMRMTANLGSVEEVETATLERSGQISIVKREHKAPTIIDIDVREGVQTVRVEFKLPRA